MSQYDEIKNLLKRSSALFGDQAFLKEEKNSIKSKHGLLLTMRKIQKKTSNNHLEYLEV